MAEASRIFVTAATGKLGTLVIDALLETLPPTAIVAGVRNPERAKTIRDKGVTVRVADYSKPDTLATAFMGVDRLLLISGNEMGRRTVQHQNVITAAKNAGVGVIAYTSILHADTSPLVLAQEHRETELALAKSGVPFVLLRNGWYTEIYTWRLAAALELGVFLGASGDGRVSTAARADYARAAAAVLSGGDHAGRTYELAGNTAFRLADFASAVEDISGKPLPYRDMAPDDLRQALLATGLPEKVAMIWSDTDAGVARQALFEPQGDLSSLIGKTTTPFQETIASFLQARSEAAHG